MKHITINRRSVRIVFAFLLLTMLGMATFAQVSPSSGLASGDGPDGPLWADCDGRNCNDTNITCNAPLSYADLLYFPHWECTYSIDPGSCNDSSSLKCWRRDNYTAGYCSGYINTTDSYKMCCGI